MVTPYITFAGNCSEALEFYKTAFNSNILMSQLYGDYVPEGVTAPPANLKNWILHAKMNICDTVFWFADEIAEPVTKGNMIKLTAKVPSAKEAQKIFDLLSIDAHITLPPTETFYSSFHAGLTDKYGISWNIVAEEAPIKS
ncbi:VOC family protein [Sedimentibacter sp.]|uniref:VOC family protein n=1 Tax=Sedimentibacter sp. TaxID=1960295 RepID=UPI0028A995F2|nr:VOC family protein [Sedimentibacter sp.]